MTGQAGALGCYKVQFIGGEPTIHPRLTALAREAHDAVTRSSGSFVRRVKGIRAVLERGIDLRVGMTLAEVVAGRNLESFRRRAFANDMSRLDWGDLGQQLLRWFPEA